MLFLYIIVVVIIINVWLILSLYQKSTSQHAAPVHYFASHDSDSCVISQSNSEAIGSLRQHALRHFISDVIKTPQTAPQSPKLTVNSTSIAPLPSSSCVASIAGRCLTTGPLLVRSLQVSATTDTLMRSLRVADAGMMGDVDG